MSFLSAARAARADHTYLRRIFSAGSFLVILVLAGFCLSCGNSNSGSASNHNAYVSLPATGNVLLLHIDGSSGAMTAAGSTPQVLNASTTGLALLPSKKFLYAVNSSANTISIFSVASDGTLTLSGTPTPAGNGPFAAAIDPSGTYLLVTNTFGSTPSGGDVSVYSIDPGSGALSEVPGSPFLANSHPSEILITPSGNSVYVTNPGIGMVTAFSFANGVLTQLLTSPVFSGLGATGMTVDGSGHFLYVANPSAPNVPPYSAATGNISGFAIDSIGDLTKILGSPFAATAGSGPTMLAIDPGGKFVYATTPGSSSSVWCFAIDPTSGQLAAVTGSPFSLAAGEQFALFDPGTGHFYIGSSTSSAINGYNYNASTGALTTLPSSPLATGTVPGKMVFSN